MLLLIMHHRRLYILFYFWAIFSSTLCCSSALRTKVAPRVHEISVSFWLSCFLFFPRTTSFHYRRKCFKLKLNLSFNETGNNGIIFLSFVIWNIFYIVNWQYFSWVSKTVHTSVLNSRFIFFWKIFRITPINYYYLCIYVDYTNWFSTLKINCLLNHVFFIRSLSFTVKETAGITVLLLSRISISNLLFVKLVTFFCQYWLYRRIKIESIHVFYLRPRWFYSSSLKIVNNLNIVAPIYLSL